MYSSSKPGGNSSSDGGSEIRRGPWTLEEDNLLINYISCHGEGRWNLLANNSGLKRTGKSCRLRWLNYLKPDVKRGNLTPEEQLLILLLHSKWGNRWSRIAQHLPGRTDNEIKNYWRTRVQTHARHLKIDTNTREFQEMIRHMWMPRLLQKIQGPSSAFLDSTLRNPALNHALQTPLGPSCPTEKLHGLLYSQPHSTNENSSSSSISSSESVNFTQDVGFLNPGCNFYYDQCQNQSCSVDNSSNDMKNLNLGLSNSTTNTGASDYIITGEWDDYTTWNMDEIWK